MFGFRKNKDSKPNAEDTTPNEVVNQPTEKVEEKQGLFSRLKSGLSKTRSSLSDGVANVFLGKKTIDDELFEDLEMLLLTADIGVETTQKIVDDLTQRASRKELADPEALYRALKDELAQVLEPVDQALTLEEKNPYVILMVGVNGVGKTTTIGKLAKRFQNEGKSVMLAAGDTFRAAAVEQLQAWGERNNVPVIAQGSGADAASVIFDAIESAKAKNVDILIADTAGRLHTQSNLMDELAKIGRVMKKIDPSYPHEAMLVVDAGTGQNALNQAKQFNEAVPLTGITLTKLDGTAKGGIIFALAHKMGVPIRFIGVGEKAEDLQAFSRNDFINALFDKSSGNDDSI